MGKIMYQLFVNGTPKAQPRPRTTKTGHVYNPHSADAWKEEIKAAFLPVLKTVIVGPVYLCVTFFLQAPKAMKLKENEKKPHDKKPDKDNLLKAVMDAMSNVGVWKDDAQVFDGRYTKWYTGGRTGAQIIVEKF